MTESDRRTKVPWSPWSKGLLAFSVLIATGIVVFTTVDEQSMYVSVEEVVSGDYQDGANLQVHGTITERGPGKPVGAIPREFKSRPRRHPAT